MKLSAELTLYPLQDNYLPIIKATVEKLNSYTESVSGLEDIKVETFPTATVLTGEFETVMTIVKDTIAWSYSEYGQCVFVAKFLPGYEAL